MTGEADIRLMVAGRTDPGRVRDHNEDSVLVAHDLALFAVADGMGGHATGQVASATVAASMRNFFEATANEPIAPDGAEDAELTQASLRLVHAIRKANRDVFEISSKHPEHRGMGSTVVALHVEGRTATIAHVGDSRCYRVRGGTILQLTGDHSLYAEALRLKPDLSDAERDALPKNVITRALGMRAKVAIDVQAVELEPGDLLVLCSDGLHGMLDDDTIAEAATLNDDLAQACELLVALANDAGGKDNVSVVLLGVYERHPAADGANDAVSVEATEAVVADLEELEGVLPPEELERLRKGEAVDVSAPRCSSCGTRIVEGNLFCTECGARVGG